MATNKNEPQQETNQRAISEDDEEWMDGASSAFPKAENLAPAVPPNYGPGRLLAIWALSKGERKNDEGKLYPFVETVTLVLDDGPDGSQTDELVGPAPVKLEGFQHSTTGLVSRLLKRVEGTNAKNVPAFSIAEPTAADMDIVRKHKDMILSINKGLEAADKASEDSEAFE
jgi:hypothetical protein